MIHLIINIIKIGEKMNSTEKFGGGAPPARDNGMGATGGGGAPAADGVFPRRIAQNSLDRLDFNIFVKIATFVPGLFAKVSTNHRAMETTQTALDANVKLDKLKKVEALFSYLSDILPPKIDADNLNFDSIRLINRLFKRVCTDIGSLESIRSNREITIQDVDGILKGTNTGQIIQEGKDASLLNFVGVLREVGINLVIPANSTPQQIREWFAAPANQEVLRGVTDLNLSETQLRHLPDEVGRFKNLEDLDLSNNPLNSVPDSIRSWFLAAVRQNGSVLELAPAVLRADREVVLAVVRKDGFDLEYAADALKANREVVLAAVTQNGWALQYASAELKGDRNIVLAAVQQFGLALDHAAPELQADRDVVLAAVERYGTALAEASPELQADRKIVLAAVRKNGWALQYASLELKGDRDIVLAAVRKDGYSLQYAADALKADKNVVLAAVTQNGLALQFADPVLRANGKVVLAAVSQNGMALEYAAFALQADPEIRAAAGLV
jgi:hypothetical protein